MKIALVILHADPSRGGAERYTVDLANALARRGEDVTLVAGSFSGERLLNERGRPVGKVKLPAQSATRLGGYLKFLPALDAHLQSTSYDIVHAMLPVPRCDVYHPHAGLAAEAIASGHLKHESAVKRSLARLAIGFNRRRLKFAEVEKRLLESADTPVVLCLSEYIKQSVRCHYHLPEQKLATLFNAVDLERFDPSNRPEARPEIRAHFNIDPQAPVALIIAQDFQRKGLREAILALSRQQNKQTVLLVVGKPDPAPYRTLARQLDLTSRVIFAGPTTDPVAFYLASDFFVLPTRHDPCSLVVLEALAMGLPVISTRFNGACEIMIDGIHGHVLPDPADVDSLAVAMNYLSDTLARQSFSQACLALRPRLSFDSHVDRLLHFYMIHLRGRSQ